ncbi:antibiotic biosynthesis monooxygenase [Staphylococcus gallinarum]|jgi:heme-degrading monooxygenase HmoA|uniref:Signal transduction protein TRAP n=3 Tax=Staphylococcus gallinarum TaxID=1293 RepID=A0A0D0SF81_STAGA|nr:antibiotic biosynthesis monooxygenase [Staphylococcus gallinarum]KIR10930.1 hypothetical protein SH09_10355 [Staphylococcus gallinarum]MBU7218267.1 antibiotic biosynthesis monooxygenase [Staphylococcus gallinarum]MCD8822316.1 antibiotic biosynthesis monooxygenase [Staphylococcus gallinarum]MCD8826667.1 antibiotic biosynthesis monooxygenase [Staphylococcus gallinarum]MCD8828812.1 antibiotic biosynthesis monooxygenase [Staphylococcus gallinarum]
MFITEVAFSTNKENEDRLYNKAKKNLAELNDNVKGLIDAEVWTKSKADEVEYVIVSKWQEKKDFQTWVARPEHVEEHKEMNKKIKSGESEPSPFKKVLKQYSVVEF